MGDIGDLARPALDRNEPIPPRWRELYAELTADWVRERGTLPTSLEELAAWAFETDSGVSVESEIAYLEGRAPDSCSPSD